ncbi:hypothetical protein BDD12DRAFT_908417 [Trichophaea hybrida]|nr:hypothetical protein BDD12DRAFT_908417 [Trichophaea hybrida]
MKLHLPIFGGVVLAVIASAMPSPSSYPRTAISTISSHPQTVDIPPTPAPELRRQVTDTLGWSDPSTCNVGVCAINRYCIVFTSDGLRANTATGMCCGQARSNCPSMHVCVPYSSHSLGPLLSNSNYRVIDGTQYCGTSYRECMTVYYEYGWGLGTFLLMNCATSAVLTTYRNPSWMLYATETNPAKGPMPTIISSSTSTSSTATSQPQTSAAPTPTSTGKGTGLPIGAIAGIAIGGIVAIGLCIVGIMLLRSRLRSNNEPPPHGGNAYQTGTATSPTVVYDGPRSPTIVYDDSQSVKNAMYPVVPQSPTYPAPQSPTYPSPQSPAYSAPQSPSHPPAQLPGGIGY